MTEVTYYMHSCNTSCMSREMMEMMIEIMPSVKLVKKGDIMGIIKIVNDNKTNLNSCLLQN